ncbi:flagellar hook assembly protein FlgD [Devosia sp. 1566]|uniref:flagellar hook assembly protein FlgD n=1 Tax=Devosia sp. 1566 TaxID=2499144 RepID=UPI000FD7C9BC|nr:flagellar hook assembly protein FlgD [Devosia sp. 1566]
MAVNGISATSAAGAISNSRNTIADNFDTFLNILTTQLKNQNPLEPLDTNQFTQQLVQFTGVEQQLKTNDFLEAMMMASQSAGKTDAVNYIGKEVTVAGTSSELKGGKALWGYVASGAVQNAKVNIKNAAGSIVYSENGSLPAGNGQFAWDGKGSNGLAQPAGLYSIEITGTDLSGNTVGITTAAVGIVNAVDFSGTEPLLTIGTSKYPLSQVRDVRTPTPGT